MRRRELWLATLLLPLGGCYATPAPGYGFVPPGYPPGEYAQPGYPPGGYAQPGYPSGGYAPPPSDPYAAYPGYGGGDGPPTYIEGGVAVPLVLYGGEWGFYDSGRHWHRAPEGYSHHLQERRDAGGEFHPSSVQPNEFHPQPGTGRPGERPAGQSAFRPVAAPTAAPRPVPAAQPRQEEHERGRACPPGQRC
jgi:hypothetical protein